MAAVSCAHLPQLSAPQVTHSQTELVSAHSAHRHSVATSARAGKAGAPARPLTRSRCAHSILPAPAAARRYLKLFS